MKLTLRSINCQTIIIHVTNCIAFVTDVQALLWKLPLFCGS